MCMVVVGNRVFWTYGSMTQATLVSPEFPPSVVFCVLCTFLLLKINKKAVLHPN